ncbi:hypothetical protein ALC60_03397 [Trachymyrmex zeteki]|uniref:Uncharacterized protein n=1 Tax=Mycetomoellerius zeteki TaxID=64791 RepID=A0A151XAP4_9HYME|nr:hypothetical protein ALC60_03397 [Trachymyrmex zeteki]
MLQKRLNNIAILHVYQDIIKDLDLEDFDWLTIYCGTTYTVVHPKAPRGSDETSRVLDSSNSILKDTRATREPICDRLELRVLCEYLLGLTLSNQLESNRLVDWRVDVHLLPNLQTTNECESSQSSDSPILSPVN